MASNKKKGERIMSKNKNAAIAIILMLTLSITLPALPTVYAQAYMPIMNLPGPDGVMHYYVQNVDGVDIDLNGPTVEVVISLMVHYPGRADFTRVGTWTVSGDLDIYTGLTYCDGLDGPFSFNETGSWRIAWSVASNPPDIPVNPGTSDGSWWSNIEDITVVASTLDLPPTYASTLIYVTAQPEGAVGEAMFIIYWTEAMPPDIGEQSGAVDSPSGRAGWYDISYTITDPDGETIDVDLPYSDPVGGGYYMFTPTKVGEYSVVCHFPGAWKNSTTGNEWWYPINSEPDNFTVRDEPLAKWVEAPMPSDYWQRPVSGGSHSWIGVVGNWLGSYANRHPIGAYGGTTDPYGYGAAPGSPHILWTRQHYPSGSLSDERLGTGGAYTLNHYQDVDFDGDDVILEGIIHYTPQYTNHWGAGSPVDRPPTDAWAGLSLYTGEQVFVKDGPVPDFASVFLYKSPNQHGAFPYLWREDVELPAEVEKDPISGPNITDTLINSGGKSAWECIDGWTLNRVCWIANVTDSGTMVYSKIGAVCYYRTYSSGGNYYLSIWNSSEALSMYSQDEGTGRWQWRPQWGGHSNYVYKWREHIDAWHNGDDCFTIDMEIPSLAGPRNSRQNQTASIRAIREDEYMVVGTTGQNDPDGIAPCWMMGISLEPGSMGNKLWETSFTPPYRNITGAGFSRGLALDEVCPEEEVIIFSDDRTQMVYAYDLATGEKLWDFNGPQFWYYGVSQTFHNGTVVLSGSYGGEAYCLDLRTGEEIWTYKKPVEGANSPYGRPLIVNPVVADGKIYFGTSEHSATTPLWRSDGLTCVDIETGEELWKIMFWGSAKNTADGILVAFNWFDGQVYAFGKGPSATTVTASPKASVHGTEVVIEGTVTDQTPTYGRNTLNEPAVFLKDTPAIADENMEEWMEYKFMEQGFPADATGVNVTLTVIDPNNNIYEVGTATSDVNGVYGMAYEPLVPGTYQIVAYFDGTESYYGSSATTYFTVEEAPAATAVPTPPPASVADMYLIPSVAGIIVAIVVVGIVLILMLRRR